MLGLEQRLSRVAHEVGVLVAAAEQLSVGSGTGFTEHNPRRAQQIAAELKPFQRALTRIGF